VSDKRTALVVDDSRAMRSVLKKVLGELDFDVVEAGNGIEGLAQLEAHHPGIDVCLVDWNMPEMDGLAFVKALRAQRAYSEIKVLMVSAENDMAKVARALMVGADEYAIKPATRDAIAEKLEMIGVGA
jgi:two-component system, chemotaxis family, chemotaxis protein CheY